MNQLNIETTRNAQLIYMLDSLGNLEVKTIVKHDTIYLKSDSVRITEVLTKLEAVEKPLTKWQKFILNFGTASFWVCVGVGFIVWLMLKFKRIV